MRRPPAIDLALALLVTAGGLALAAAPQQGGWVLAQDDGYVHLATARTLLQHGAWGVAPGEAVAASSSPLWVAALLLPLALGLEPVAAAVGLAALASGLAVLAAGALLGSEIRGNRRGASLLAVVLCGRLLALPATGLEHGLHAALTLALLALLRRDPTGPGVVGLGALLVALRPEHLFLLPGLSLVLLLPGAGGPAALWGGTLLGLAVLAQGLGALGVPALPAAGPDPALRALALEQGWLAAVAGRLFDNLSAAPALGLLGAASLLAGRRRWAVVLASAALLQLLLGRTGNLFRYEAWLLAALAALLLAPSTPTPRRAEVGLRLGAVALATLLGLQAPVQAVQGIAWQRQGLGRVAALLESPDAPGRIGVVNGGQARFQAPATALDLACRTSPEVVPHCAQGQLSRAALDALQARAALVAAVLPGERALAGDWPVLASFETRGGGRSMDWRVLRASQADEGALSTWLDAAAGRAGLQLSWAVPALEPWTLDGALAEELESEVALYGNGALHTRVRRPGPVVLEARGSRAEGRGPRVTVEVDGVPAWQGELAEEGVAVDLGRLRRGQAITLRYEDDAVDAQGGDRNVWVRGP